MAHKGLWRAYSGDDVSGLFPRYLEEICPKIDTSWRFAADEHMKWMTERDGSATVLSYLPTINEDLLAPSIKLALNDWKTDLEYIESVSVRHCETKHDLGRAILLGSRISIFPGSERIVNAHFIRFAKTIYTVLTLPSDRGNYGLAYRIISVNKIMMDTYILHCIRFPDGINTGISTTVAVKTKDPQLIQQLFPNNMIWVIGWMCVQIGESVDQINYGYVYTATSYQFGSSKGIFYLSDYITPYTQEHPYSGIKHFCPYFGKEKYKYHYLCGCDINRNIEEKHVTWNPQVTPAFEFLSLKDRLVVAGVSNEWKRRSLTDKFKRRCRDYILNICAEAKKQLSTRDMKSLLPLNNNEVNRLNNYDAMMRWGDKFATKEKMELWSDKELFRWTRRFIITSSKLDSPHNHYVTISEIMKEKVVELGVVGAIYMFTDEQFEQIPTFHLNGRFCFVNDVMRFRQHMPIEVDERFLGRGYKCMFKDTPKEFKKLFGLEKREDGWYIIKKDEEVKQPPKKKRRLDQ